MRTLKTAICLCNLALLRWDVHVLDEESRRWYIDNMVMGEDFNKWYTKHMLKLHDGEARIVGDTEWQKEYAGKPVVFTTMPWSARSSCGWLEWRLGKVKLFSLF